MKSEQDLLIDAKEHIKSLRSDNRNMRLRLQMFDDIMLLLRTNPQQQVMGMGEDIVWKIEKHLEAEKAG